MPRGKKQKKRRRGNSAISLSGLAEGVMIANVGTQAMFNSNAWDFLTAGTTLNPNTKWTGQGSQVISLKELIVWPSTATGGSFAGMTQGQVVMDNLKNNALQAVISATLIPVGFKLGRRLLRRPITMGNRLLKQAGLRSMVKI